MSGGVVKAVLWDADGVLQRGPSQWDDSFEAVLGDRADQIVTEIFAPLERALVGDLDMVEHVSAVLGRYGLSAEKDRLLEVWKRIYPVPQSRRLAAALAVPGYLATNQDSWRAACMRAQMGYEDLLAGAYYSFEVGAAKPQAGFFAYICADLRAEPSELLLVDDNADNIAGALEVGLQAIRWHHDEGIEELRLRLAEHEVAGG